MARAELVTGEHPAAHARARRGAAALVARGTRIAFWGLRGNSGQRDLWTIPADAKGEPAAVSVTDDPAMDWNPVWSPDGRCLYFSSERGGSMNLWRVAIDDDTGRTRGEPEPVTTPSRTSGSISFSRDGKQMMYVSSDRRSSIQRVGLDPATGRVTDPPRPVFRGSRVIYTQDISPNGEWIAFTTLGGREDLFVVKSDGTGYRQITDDAFRDRGPRGRRTARGSRSTATAAAATRPGRSGPTAAASSSSRRPPGPPARRSPGRPTATRIATNDSVKTWIEDLTQPLDQRQAEALPQLEGGHALQPRSWSPDGEHAGRRPRVLHVARQRHAALLVRHARPTPRCPRAAAGPAWMSDSRRLLVARYDRIVLLDTRRRPGDAGARGGPRRGSACRATTAG